MSMCIEHEIRLFELFWISWNKLSYYKCICLLMSVCDVMIAVWMFLCQISCLYEWNLLISDFSIRFDDLTIFFWIWSIIIIFLSLNPLDYITKLHFLFVFSIRRVFFSLCIWFICGLEFSLCFIVYLLHFCYLSSHCIGLLHPISQCYRHGVKDLASKDKRFTVNQFSWNKENFMYVMCCVW